MHSFINKNARTMVLAGAGLVVSLVGFGALEAQAMPEMKGAGSASFARMDADKDGKGTKEEFMAAFPDMREQAFAAIDPDSDGAIIETEWLAFFSNHAKDVQQNNGALPASEGAPAAASGGTSGDAPGDALGDQPADGSPALIKPGKK